MNTNLTFTAFLFFCFHLSLNAQTIDMADGAPGCITGTTVNPIATFSLAGNDGGTPQRNIYTVSLVGPAATVPYIIIWDNVDGRWEVQVDYRDAGGNLGGTDGVYETDMYSNSFASAPNPPELGTGTWAAVPLPADFGIPSCGDIGGGISQFNGSGTQSTLTLPTVPTLSEWGLITLALLLLNFGVLAIIQQREFGIN